MATVSILIPAFKPEYLAQALLSAQQQIFADVEILVGDDTADGRLASIVARFDDPRVRYFHHGFQDGLRNSSCLWERAAGRYVKWLYDDDVLMPESVQVLVEALEAHPESALAFHQRVIIDERDSIKHVPPALLNFGERCFVTRDFLAHNMVGKLDNFIGEPTNALVRRALVDDSETFRYRSAKLQYLNDVAMFLGLAERAPLVAVGGYYSAFRLHGSQNSSVSSPLLSAGCYEWEILVRGEAAAGNLSCAEVVEAARRLHQRYAQWVSGLPELARFVANLPELTERALRELFDSERFRADLAFAEGVVAERKARNRDAAAVAAQAASAQPDVVA